MERGAQWVVQDGDCVWDDDDDNINMGMDGKFANGQCKCASTACQMHVKC